MSTELDDVDELERTYHTKLQARCELWMDKNPVEAIAIRQSIWDALRPLGLIEHPPAGTFRDYVIRQQVYEAIRVRKGWPSIREFAQRSS